MTSTIAGQGQHRWTGGTVAWVVGGALVVSSLAWVDAVFLPLVLLGPPLAGVVVGLRHGARLPLVMAGLASGAHWLTTLVVQAGFRRSTRGLSAGEAQSRAGSPDGASRRGRARR